MSIVKKHFYHYFLEIPFWLNFSPSCLTENSPENYAFLPFFIHDSKVIEFLFADSVVIEENFCTRNKKKFELA